MRREACLAVGRFYLGRPGTGQEPRRNDWAADAIRPATDVEGRGQDPRIVVVMAGIVANRAAVMVGRSIADDVSMHLDAIPAGVQVGVWQQAHQRDRKSGRDRGDARGQGRKHSGEYVGARRPKSNHRTGNPSVAV